MDGSSEAPAPSESSNVPLSSESPLGSLTGTTTTLPSESGGSTLSSLMVGSSEPKPKLTPEQEDQKNELASATPAETIALGESNQRELSGLLDQTNAAVESANQAVEAVDMAEFERLIQQSNEAVAAAQAAAQAAEKVNRDTSSLLMRAKNALLRRKGMDEPIASDEMSRNYNIDAKLAEKESSDMSGATISRMNVDQMPQFDKVKNAPFPIYDEPKAPATETPSAEPETSGVSSSVGTPPGEGVVEPMGGGLPSSGPAENPSGFPPVGISSEPNGLNPSYPENTPFPNKGIEEIPNPTPTSEASGAPVTEEPTSLDKPGEEKPEEKPQEKKKGGPFGWLRRAPKVAAPTIAGLTLATATTADIPRDTPQTAPIQRGLDSNPFVQSPELAAQPHVSDVSEPAVPLGPDQPKQATITNPATGQDIPVSDLKMPESGAGGNQNLDELTPDQLKMYWEKRFKNDTAGAGQAYDEWKAAHPDAPDYRPATTGNPMMPSERSYVGPNATDQQKAVEQAVNMTLGIAGQPEAPAPTENPAPTSSVS